MKTKAMYAAAGLCLLMIFSCQGPKTLPFEADFTGIYVGFYPDTVNCGPDFMHVKVDVTGQNELLGAFTGHFDFCADSLGYYPGPLGPHMKAYLVAENGDSLYIGCSGQVIPGKLDDHADYVISYWRDPFEIYGGSGKFEGASGEGMTDDYNSSQDQNSHHRWKGTITLVKQ